MQARINLWLWRFRNVRPSHGRYHLRADAAACRGVIARLRAPEFVKASFGLRAVPERMTKILAVRDGRFVGFDRLWVFREDGQEAPAVFAEAPEGLDMYLTAAGIAEFTEALGDMCDGQWDFKACETWFWGLLSEAEYRKTYG